MTANEALIQLFNESFSSEEEIVKSIRANSGDLRPVYSLKGINERRAWYYLFVENDLEKAKQCFFLYGKVQEYLCKSTTVSMILGMTQDNTYALLSDAKDLIYGMVNWKYAGYEKDIKKGSLKYIIPLVAIGEDDKALALLDLFHLKHRKMGLKEENEAIIRAIISGEAEEVNRLLQIFLLPRNHKKTNGIYQLRSELFSLPALGFAKLAWLRGVEVDIDHPLIPKALLPIQPNTTYDKTYDFLK
ncbi:hypothetical protein E7Z59_13095 [Robertkochia marina]|uniref:Uncharacterized protein n=1 Tax=Robertkochia marina TaxID=1227945 RepID=A0A4V3UY00_9FLAO|nr:Imm49 family immunity protein [Robertkochia marina]THD66714.1 hypothetical protein E7Z59_13095 [Robertkochia marina]TRZ42397.1 hypothetical protein D3A96_12110 [Robertkochia marina]